MKTTLIFLFVTLCATHVSAQTETARSGKLSINLIGGINVSKNTGYYYGDMLTSKPGYSFGIGVVKPVANDFEIQTRFLYESKRSAVTYQFGLSDGTNESYDVTRNVDTKLNYYTLQVIPTVRFGRSKQFYAGAGGYYSLLDRGSVRAHDVDVAKGYSRYFDMTASEALDKTYDAGLSFIAGYSIQINERRTLGVEVSYNTGLVDIHDPFNTSQRNKSVNLTLSYKLFGRKK